MKPSHFFLVGLVFFFKACSFFGQAEPSSHVTVSITPHQIGTEQTVLASTAVPSSTLSPSLTSSPEPSFTPSPTRPRPSPTLPPFFSSLKIAFAADEQIWLWENETFRPITNVEGYAQVRISDDGSLIAFRRAGGLWVIDTDVSNERLLVGADVFESLGFEDRDVELSQFDWIPGTHILWFNTRISGFGLYYSDDLYQANADTGQWKMLRQPGEGGKFIFSPDGLRVVLITPRKISLMNIDGSGYRTVLEYFASLGSETYYYARPFWGTNSQSLIVSIPPQLLLEEPIWTINTWRLFVDNRPPALVSQLEVGENKDDASYWFWAPDLEHYATFSDADKMYYLGSNGEYLEPLAEPTTSIGWFTWIDLTYYIYLGNCSLKFGTIGAPSITILDSSLFDSCLTDYDFLISN